MQQQKKAKLTRGNIWKSFIQLSIPMIFGMLSMGMFNLADTFFVGKLGTEQLSALSFIFPVVLIVNSVALGIGIGTSVLVSIAEGGGNREEVRRLSIHSLVLGLIVTVVVAVFGELTISPLFSALGASGEVLNHIHDYMFFWYPGVIAVVIPMVINNILRAIGNSFLPGMVMFISMLINIILDPLLIFGLGPFPEMGISGAAIATVFARSIAAVTAIYALHKFINLFSSGKQIFRGICGSWKKIVHIGAPNGFIKMIHPIAIAVITRQLSPYGVDVVAGFGVGTRIEFFALALMAAIASITGPFIGQNIGGHEKNRVFKGMMVSKTYALTAGGIIALLLFVFSENIATVFNDDYIVNATTVLYISILPVSYGMQGVMRICSSVLNVIKKPFTAASIVLVHILVFYLPLAFLGEYFLGVTGLFLALSTASVITAVLSHTISNHFVAKKFSD